MRDAGHRTPDIGQRTSDGEKSKNNISTPQGGGHNYIYVTKCNNRILCQVGALSKVREVFHIEQNILLQYKKESNLINNKWNPLLNFFQEFFKDNLST